MAGSAVTGGLFKFRRVSGSISGGYQTCCRIVKELSGKVFQKILTNNAVGKSSKHFVGK